MNYPFNIILNVKCFMHVKRKTKNVKNVNKLKIQQKSKGKETDQLHASNVICVLQGAKIRH